MNIIKSIKGQPTNHKNNDKTDKTKLRKLHGVKQYQIERFHIFGFIKTLVQFHYTYLKTEHWNKPSRQYVACE